MGASKRLYEELEQQCSLDEYLAQLYALYECELYYEFVDEIPIKYEQL
jgi:hypothetical protein